MRQVIAILLLFGGLLPVARSSAAAVQYVDLRISSADIWSEEVCDENGDGQVDFKGIPHGRYLLIETRAPDGYLPVEGLASLISRPPDGGIRYLYVDHERE